MPLVAEVEGLKVTGSSNPSGGDERQVRPK
jgi:hypothetical protein